MKFDLLTGGQEIKLAILVKFWLFLPLFCLFSSYFFASITFGDGFFQFQDNKVRLKQAPGHNHENTIFQPGQCPINLRPGTNQNAKSRIKEIQVFYVVFTTWAPVLYIIRFTIQV